MSRQAKLLQYLPGRGILPNVGCGCLHNDVYIKIGIIYKNDTIALFDLAIIPILEYSMGAKQISINLHILPAAGPPVTIAREIKGFFFSGWMLVVSWMRRMLLCRSFASFLVFIRFSRFI